MADHSALSGGGVSSPARREELEPELEIVEAIAGQSKDGQPRRYAHTLRRGTSTPPCGVSTAVAAPPRYTADARDSAAIAVPRFTADARDSAAIAVPRFAADSRDSAAIRAPKIATHPRDSAPFAAPRHTTDPRDSAGSAVPRHAADARDSAAIRVPKAAAHPRDSAPFASARRDAGAVPRHTADARDSAPLAVPRFAADARDSTATAVPRHTADPVDTAPIAVPRITRPQSSPPAPVEAANPASRPSDSTALYRRRNTRPTQSAEDPDARAEPPIPEAPSAIALETGSPDLGTEDAPSCLPSVVLESSPDGMARLRSAVDSGLRNAVDLARLGVPRRSWARYILPVVLGLLIVAGIAWLL